MNKSITTLFLITAILFSSVIAAATPDETKVVHNTSQPDKNNRSWQKLGDIKTNYEKGSAHSSQIALDPASNTITVWQQYDKPIRQGGQSMGYWASRYTPKNGWSKAERISTDEAEYPSDLTISMDSSGNAVVTWVDNQIWSITYTINKGWGKAQRIKNSLSASSGPHVVMNSSGRGIMVWDKFYKGIWAAHYDPENGWGDPVNVYDGATLFAIPKVAINDSGNALLTWAGRTQKKSPSPSDIMTSYYTPEAGWSDAEKLKTQYVYAITTTIDPSGNGHIAWTNIKPDIINVWSSRYTLGKGWSKEHKINTVASDQHTEVRLATNSLGTTFAVWGQKKEKCYCLWVNYFTEKAGWSKTQRIDKESGSGSISRLELSAADASGNIIAIWQQDHDIWATHLSPKNKKGVTRKLNDHAKIGFSGDPISDISMTPDGNAIVVWAQQHDKRYITKFRQFK